MSLTAYPTGGFFREDDPGEPSSNAPRVSVTLGEAHILAELVTGLRVLEIGTGLGVSTAHMAATAASLTTVDIDPWVQQTIWPTLPEHVICAKSTSDLFGPFDAVFIDGDHTPAAVAADLLAAERLAPGGLLIAHDVNYSNVRDQLGDGWTMIATEYGIATRRLP